MKSNIKRSELFLFALVILASITANLPDQILSGLLDKKLLLTVLTAVVVVALFRYLRLLLFLCVMTLAIGANLPETLADALGISEEIMLGSLGALALVSLVNAYFKMLPVDNVQGMKKEDSPESRKAVMISVSKGNLIRLKWLINRNVEINFSEDGTSPAIVAAEKGQSEIMQLLIRHGADLEAMNKEGKTPLEIALANGFNHTAEIIRFAFANPMSPAEDAAPATEVFAVR